MPTRKQRRRALKERRHEYETVWVDEEGNEVEEPPEELVAASRRSATALEAEAEGESDPAARRPPDKRSPAAVVAAATKRALLIGVVIFVFIYITGHNGVAALVTGGHLHAALHPVPVHARPLHVQALAAARRTAGTEGRRQALTRPRAAPVGPLTTAH